MGRHSYGDPWVQVHRGDTGRVDVGAFCSIAAGVEFVLGGNHRVDWVSTYPFRIRWDLPGAFTDGHPSSKGNIVVGNDMWLGRRATILSGVTSGDDAVVAASSLVTKDVRPYAIVGGNPAIEIRRRFEDDVVDALQRIRWWTWQDEAIRALVRLLCSGDVDAFLAAAEGGMRPRIEERGDGD